MFERKDTFIPSLKVGQIIRDDRYAYKILGIKRQNSNEIVYDAYGEITYDFPPRRTRIEVVEYVSEEYENRKYESIHYPQNYGFIRDELENSIEVAIGTSSFIVDDKRFYCQLSYDVRKLKIGDSLYLSKKQYVVNNVCGHGSYGEILKLRCVSYSYRNKLKQWFTRSKRSNDCLALKQFQMSQSIELQSTVVLEESAMNSFVLGYEAMSQLSHPNIVEVYDFYFKSGIPCFTMEYVDGLNLREFVERNGCLPLDEAKEILQTISKTIDYCHEKGIHHGDLKPNNVMITTDGVIRLIDIAGGGCCPDEFGIARIYFYLLTGIYIELPQNCKISKLQMEMFAKELDKKEISDSDISHVLKMLGSGLNTKLKESEKEQVPILSENPSLALNVLNPQFPSSVKSNVPILKDLFSKYMQDGLYGMKNQDGEVVIPPIYTSITPVGCYHIPGSGPCSGWDIVGVMTFHDELTGWYEIVDNNRMKLVIECTTSEIRCRQMMT